MATVTYIGFFRRFASGEWQASFPDVPGCHASGSTFEKAVAAAEKALAQRVHKGNLNPPRSLNDLMAGSSRSGFLYQQMTGAVLRPIVVKQRPDQDENEETLIAENAAAAERGRIAAYLLDPTSMFH